MDEIATMTAAAIWPLPLAKIEAEMYVAPKILDCGQKLPKGLVNFCSAFGRRFLAANGEVGE